jgi:hypothetical protein
VQDGGDLVAIRPDDSGFRTILYQQDNSTFWDPSWAPHSRRLAFEDPDYLSIGLTYFWHPETYGTGLTGESLNETDPAWSPDGPTVLYSRDDVETYEYGNVERSLRDYDLFVVPAEGGESRRLEEEPSDSFGGTWMPDGTRIAFSSDRKGSFDIYVMNADGTGLMRLTTSPGDDIQPAWTGGP